MVDQDELQCGRCGYEDLREHFDDSGMDKQCPHCGKMPVTEDVL